MMFRSLWLCVFASACVDLCIAASRLNENIKGNNALINDNGPPDGELLASPTSIVTSPDGRVAHQQDARQAARSTAGPVTVWNTELADEELIPVTEAIVPSGKNPIRPKRAATAVKEKLWPNATIPYIIGNVTANVSRYITAAIDHWQMNTCLKFVNKTSQHRDYVVFNTGICGCCSFVGRKGGHQEVILSAHCATYGVVIHEIGHVIGFWHEHSRPDRDDYVNILRGNVATDKLENFNRKSHGEINSHGEPYDYQSIMHYNPKTFSRNGLLDTMSPRENGVTIGQRRALSAGDIVQTRLLYRCPKRQCRVELTAMDGSFTSPNYPDHYFKDHECLWIIRAATDESITLKFYDFSTEYSINCSYDYVELRELPTKWSGGSVVGRLCGEGGGYTGSYFQTFPGRSLSVKFVSDSSMTDRGFWAYYYKQIHMQDDEGSGMLGYLADVPMLHPAVERPTAFITNCNRIYRDSRSTISSPLVPVDYIGQPVECSWTIDGGRNASRIRITIDTAAPDIRERHCLGNVFQSPNPGSFSMQVESMVSSPLFRYVHRPLVFTGYARFHTGQHQQQQQRTTYWRHYREQQQQQQQQRQQELGRHRMGVRSRRQVDSSSWLVNDSGDRFVPVSYDCFSASPLLIPSHQTVVMWTSDVNKAIQFTYDIDYDECALRTDSCQHICENTFTGYRCQCNLGYTLHSDGTTCRPKLQQVSGSCVNGRTINMSSERGIIDVNLTSLMSPRSDHSFSSFPAASTVQTVDCQWHIQPPDDDSGITLQFNLFRLEAGGGPGGGGVGGGAAVDAAGRVKSTCQDSYVEVRIGKNLTNRGKRYCGKKLPPVISTESGSVFVRLKLVLSRSGWQQLSRVRAPAQYLSAQYFAHKQSSTSHCFHKIRLPSSKPREVTSPGFPKAYPNDVACTWRLSARGRDDRLSVTIVELDVEQTENCSFDFLEFRAGNKGKVLGRFCGNLSVSSSPISFSTERQLWMSFVTDSSGFARGFRAIVTSQPPPSSSSSSSPPTTSPFKMRSMTSLPPPPPSKRQATKTVSKKIGAGVDMKVTSKSNEYRLTD